MIIRHTFVVFFITEKCLPTGSFLIFVDYNFAISGELSLGHFCQLYAKRIYFRHPCMQWGIPMLTV